MRIIRTLLLSVALLVAGQWLMAEDAVIGHVSLDGLYYNLNTEEQTAVVTWEVKDNAANCTGLTEIVLPDGVTKIPRAFTACSALRSVTVGNAVTEIGISTGYVSVLTCNTKRLVNGRLLIEKDGNVYSVTGQDVRQ